MDEHYLTPLFAPQSMAVFAGRADDAAAQTRQARQLHAALRAQRYRGELHFLEVNLNCNLWSQKVFGRSAVRAGWTQEQLIETIVAESLRSHGLMD